VLLQSPRIGVVHPRDHGVVREANNNTETSFVRFLPVYIASTSYLLNSHDLGEFYALQVLPPGSSILD
jgi:hypothetical protein